MVIAEKGVPGGKSYRPNYFVQVATDITCPKIRITLSGSALVLLINDKCAFPHTVAFYPLQNTKLFHITFHSLVAVGLYPVKFFFPDWINCVVVTR